MRVRLGSRPATPASSALVFCFISIFQSVARVTKENSRHAIRPASPENSFFIEKNLPLSRRKVVVSSEPRFPHPHPNPSLVAGPVFRAQSFRFSANPEYSWKTPFLRENSGCSGKRGGRKKLRFPSKGGKKNLEIGKAIIKYLLAKCKKMTLSVQVEFCGPPY